MGNSETTIAIAGILGGTIMVIALSVGMAFILRGPVGQALARRISGKSAEADPELAGEIGNLRAELDQVQHRLAEAEERLDFSERLLAQKERPALERGA